MANKNEQRPPRILRALARVGVLLFVVEQMTLSTPRSQVFVGVIGGIVVDVSDAELREFARRRFMFARVQDRNAALDRRPKIHEQRAGHKPTFR